MSESEPIKRNGQPLSCPQTMNKGEKPFIKIRRNKMRFKKATRSQLKLRMAIDGPAGSGKTYTALRFAFSLGKRIAIIDTEHGSASKYLFKAPDGIPWEFDVCELERFSPTDYTSLIDEAGSLGYDVIVIDSLSHAWVGEGGALDMWDKAGGRFQSWKNITPLHNKMIEAMLHSPSHIIATMRSKMDYVVEEEMDGGRKKSVPRKVGLAPVQRNGMEYEFDIWGTLDLNHIFTISKTRCTEIDGAVAALPSASFMRPVVDWLKNGTPAPAQSEVNAQETTTQPLEDNLKPLRDEISKLRRKHEWLLGVASGDDSDLESVGEDYLRKVHRNLEVSYTTTIKSKIRGFYTTMKEVDSQVEIPSLNDKTIIELEQIYKNALAQLKDLKDRSNSRSDSNLPVEPEGAVA
jgi:hypothetical protein